MLPALSSGVPTLSTAPTGAPSRAALLATLTASLATLTALALARHLGDPPLPFDRAVQRWSRTRRLGPRRRTTARAVADTCAQLTGQWPPAIAGALAAAAVARRLGVRPALPVLAAVPLGNAAHAALKYTRRHHRPLLARLTGKRTPSFPSGHATRAAAAAGILAHVAARDGRVPASVVLPAAAAVALVGAGQRVWVERHWATDVIGGWALGAAVAAGCAGWYDGQVERSR